MKPNILFFLGIAALSACARSDNTSTPVPPPSSASAHELTQDAAVLPAPKPQRAERAAMAQAQAVPEARFADQAVSMGKVVGLAVPPMPAANEAGEGYAPLAENRFQQVALSPLSTFGLDVDTASYSNVRRFLSQGQLPPVDAVRIEELINYFDYPLSATASEHPLSISTESAAAPWNPAHRLVMVGVKARDLNAAERPPNRLVFLLDTSGSMSNANKLPLLKRSFQILIEQLRAQDSVAIVTYAGSAGLVLPPTSGAHKEAIYAALNRLSAGGSTAGAQGLELAYEVAAKQFVEAANNRVILATDGDFNVGQRSEGDLIRLIESRRDQGVFLSVLGFGSGNYQEAKMQQLSSHGNGTHHYIDSDREADRVFRDKLQGTLYTVAKDAKIQLEWNPQQVAEYRLIGYENRLLNAEDFVDDRKDAGDVGAGHSITVLYEVVPASGANATAAPLRYQEQRPRPAHATELGLIKLRYKPAKAERSVEMTQVIASTARAGDNLAWAAAVAELGMLLRGSEHRAQANYDDLLRRVEAQAGDDALRREFVGLVRQAKVASQSQLGLNQPGQFSPGQ